MKRIIVMILLLLMLAGTGIGAVTLYNKTADLRAENEALVREANQQVETAKAAYDAIDPSTTQGAERQLQSDNAAVAEAEQRADALEAEIREIENSIRAAQEELNRVEADEETAYYMEAYDSLREGMEKVEGYIEGN